MSEINNSLIPTTSSLMSHRINILEGDKLFHSKVAIS